MEEGGDIIIFDTDGGSNATITRIEWHVFECTNNKQRLMGYQDKSEGKVYPIFNAVTEAWVQGRYMTILLVMNNETLLDYPDKT